MIKHCLSEAGHRLRDANSAEFARVEPRRSKRKRSQAVARSGSKIFVTCSPYFYFIGVVFSLNTADLLVEIFISYHTLPSSGWPPTNWPSFYHIFCVALGPEIPLRTHSLNGLGFLFRQMSLIFLSFGSKGSSISHLLLII